MEERPDESKLSFKMVGVVVCVAGSESVCAEWGPGCCCRYWAQQTLRGTWLLWYLVFSSQRRPHGSCPGSSGQTQRVEDGGAYAFQTQVPGRADLHGCLHPSRPKKP
ncbi:uncharacterized protein isoform X6 [Macaca fascicularis]|uniref:uncharacterized protein isoform X3 n=1 Tax=Macaca fascicularis TaxID=9541 RepID=UPI0032B03E34